MASDSPDSCRKHPHSPSEDDSRDRSKRHKHHHRHHHRSHRHNQRHSSGSKDHVDERRGDVDEATNVGLNAGGAQEVVEVACLTQAQPDSEMEEGEIVEDDDLSACRAEFEAVKVMSDSESGEIRSVYDPSRAGNSNTKIMDHEGEFGLSDDLSLVNSNKTRVGELKSLANGGRKENKANGDVGYRLSNKSLEDDGRRHRRSRSPAKRMNKHEERRVKYHDEASDRSMSKSPKYLRRKSDSETILVEKYSRHSHGLAHLNNDRAGYNLHDEITAVPSGDNKYHGRDSTRQMRDKDRERKHAIDKDRYINNDSLDVETGEKHRDRKVEREVKVRDRDHEEEKQHLESDRVQKFSRAREAKKESDHDRMMEKLERNRDTIHDYEYDEGRYREKDYRRSKERDREQEGEHWRGSSRYSYKDRDMEREWEKGRERHRDRSTDVCERVRDNGSDRERRHYGRDHEDRYGSRGRSYDSKHRAYDSEDHHRDRKRISDSGKGHICREDALKESEKRVNRDEDDQDEYSENMDQELLVQEEEDINRIKEESRKRKEAILKKYRTKESQSKVDSQSDTSGKAINKEISGEPSGVHAAAHDLQGKPDDEAHNGDQDFSVGKSPSQNKASLAEKSSGAGALGEGTPKSERSNDMFRDDIFGDSPAKVRKTGKGDGLLVDRSGLHDNWDDSEGYYGYRLGEILDCRYEITAAHGKGVFSTVVRATDLKAGNGDPEEVAIKIIRNNDTMLKAGMDELVILKKLVGADPDDRRHCVRYISSFKYRNHLCLVFESLHMNLREILKKFGRNIGLKLTAVRTYSKQLFIALKHLKNSGVLHCDIKPDNMLVNEAKNVLKLCDFGNAMFAGKNEVTPYLVSRFYRAPEIILGLTYDHPLDVWSVGCCLYELFTGKVLFPGHTNNDMIRLHMELKGPFPKKILRKGAFTDQHFDQDLNFLAIEEDLVTKKTIRRLIVNIKPKDIGTIIKGSPGEDPKMLSNFKDLLDKIFVLDPDKRLTVSQVLSHPFITGK